MHQPVENDKYNLSHKEVIVDGAANECTQRKCTAPPMIHIFIHCPQEQRKENNGFVEMVEEDIIDGKT